jgi:uncharacterized protein with FMN-binding domain
VGVNVELGLTVFVGLRVGARVGVTVQVDDEVAGRIDSVGAGCAAVDVGDGVDVAGTACVIVWVTITVRVDSRAVLQPLTNRQQIKVVIRHFVLFGIMHLPQT